MLVGAGIGNRQGVHGDRNGIAGGAAEPIGNRNCVSGGGSRECQRVGDGRIAEIGARCPREARSTGSVQLQGIADAQRVIRARVGRWYLHTDLQRCARFAGGASCNRVRIDAVVIDGWIEDGSVRLAVGVGPTTALVGSTLQRIEHVECNAASAAHYRAVAASVQCQHFRHRYESGVVRARRIADQYIEVRAGIARARCVNAAARNVERTGPNTCRVDPVAQGKRERGVAAAHGQAVVEASVRELVHGNVHYGRIRCARAIDDLHHVVPITGYITLQRLEVRVVVVESRIQPHTRGVVRSNEMVEQPCTFVGTDGNAAISACADRCCDAHFHTVHRGAVLRVGHLHGVGGSGGWEGERVLDVGIAQRCTGAPGEAGSSRGVQLSRIAKAEARVTAGVCLRGRENRHRG